MTSGELIGETVALIPGEDLIMLFDALGEQVRAVADARPDDPLPVSISTQYNLLVQNANQLEGVILAETTHKLIGTPVSEILSMINYAIAMLQIYEARRRGVEGGTDTVAERKDAAELHPHADERKVQKPRVFIGCSVEGLRYAKVIQLQLSNSTNTAIWNQGVFGLSTGTLETLVAECRRFDYAILVLTPDDTRTKREREGSIPRDNVVFELGLFIGALGRERVYMVVQAGTELPSDLAGITPANFDMGEGDINLVSALGPSVTRLEIAMGLM